jgi:hypothetical protein
MENPLSKRKIRSVKMKNPLTKMEYPPFKYGKSAQ